MKSKMMKFPSLGYKGIEFLENELESCLLDLLQDIGMDQKIRNKEKIQIIFNTLVDSYKKDVLEFHGFPTKDEDQ